MVPCAIFDNGYSKAISKIRALLGIEIFLWKDFAGTA
jgi:hypothetical protein